MQPSADLIARFLAARESGHMPEAILRELEYCYRRPEERKRKVAECLRTHYLSFELPKRRSANCAALEIDIQLQALARNYDDTNVPPEYRLLFDRISELGERLPGCEKIRKIVGKN